MSSATITSRFAVTFVSNGLRGAMAFLTGVFVARGLGPEQFGNFNFLLATFLAIRQLMDVGTSTAFYTFMSQRPRGGRFMRIYAAWLLLQFAVPFALVAVLLPRVWIDLVWLGQDRGLVLLGFAATFLQQQAWQAVTQVGESRRLTHRVQAFNVGIALVHLCVVLLLWRLDKLAVSTLFGIVLVEHAIALSIAWRLLARSGPEGEREATLESTWREFAHYCKPLVLYSWLGFAFTFFENWLLRNFGGAREQAFYGVGYQFAQVGLFFTTAMLQIFWKEIAEAYEAGRRERVETLFRSISRFLYFSGAFISAFLVPWSRDITRLVLGPEYEDGWPVIAVMLLFPVHISLSQIGSTTLLATGKTRVQVTIGMIYMAVSIPISYLVVAPAGAWIPGLGLGALGIALKLVLLQLVVVNVTLWWLSRINGWRFEWAYQAWVLGALLLLGWLSRSTVLLLEPESRISLVLHMVAALGLYSLVAAGLIWKVPQLLGMTGAELRVRMSRVPGLGRL